MPAGVMHARIAGPSPALARMMHGRLTQLKYRYGIPHLAVHPTGVQLPADQSEHVDAGDVVTDLGAVARATAMGTQQPASTHPACASSHCCNGKATDSQARSHPCALASPAELTYSPAAFGIPGNSLRFKASVQASLARIGPVVCLESRAAATQH